MSRTRRPGLTNSAAGLVNSPMASRSTAAATEARVAEVAAMLTTSPRGEIVAMCRKKWGVSPRTVDDYIATARKQLADTFKDEIEAEGGIAKARLERIFHKAEKAEDFTAAIAAQRELIKLMGLASPEKIEHSLPAPELAEWLRIRRGGQRT